jgi:2-succinyl-6-hydroxy-2,4-cyclohexadiene-1-carboxylate synthase
MDALHYQTSGDSDNQAIFFLHGFLGDGQDWALVVDRLLASYFCVCVDLPGHGKSSIAPGKSKFNVIDVTNAFIDVVDELGVDHFSLCGYSMGGRTALYIATQFAMRVDHLILESTTAGIESAAERATRRESDAALAKRMNEVPFDAFLREWYAQPLFEGIDAEKARFEAMLMRRQEQNPAELAKSLGILGQGVFPSLWHELHLVTLPTLLVTGERDATYRSLAEAMAAKSPAMEHTVIAKAGHNVHFEQPESYTQALLSFMARRTIQ